MKLLLYFASSPNSVHSGLAVCPFIECFMVAWRYQKVL